MSISGTVTGNTYGHPKGACPRGVAECTGCNPNSGPAAEADVSALGLGMAAFEASVASADLDLRYPEDRDGREGTRLYLVPTRLMSAREQVESADRLVDEIEALLSQRPETEEEAYALDVSIGAAEAKIAALDALTAPESTHLTGPRLAARARQTTSEFARDYDGTQVRSWAENVRRSNKRLGGMRLERVEKFAEAMNAYAKYQLELVDPDNPRPISSWTERETLYRQRALSAFGEACRISTQTANPGRPISPADSRAMQNKVARQAGYAEAPPQTLLG